MALALSGIMFSAVHVTAQVPGDINCNGFVDVSDMVRFIDFLNNPCDFLIDTECLRLNSDIDLDGRPMTIGDILIAPSLLNANAPPPYLPQHPEQDTITVASAIASPGDTLVLPIRITTADTIFAYQFLLDFDTDFIEFDTMVVYDPHLLHYSCSGEIYAAASHPDFYEYILLPGHHHIADIIVTAKLENEIPITTYISFTSNRPLGLYSGFANCSFFQPVLVDAEIRIEP